jgi:hypothetical protein
MMGFTKAQEKHAYLALLGPDGRVLWVRRGPFAEDAMADLKAAVSAAGDPGSLWRKSITGC